MAAFLGVIGIVFAVAISRRSEPEMTPSPSRLSKPRVSGEAYAKAMETRQELVLELVQALEQAAAKNERPKMAQAIDGLVREGDAVISAAVENLKKSRVWNFRIALLEVLSRLRSAPAVAVLEEFYATLQAPEKALKVEVVRRLGKMGGTLPREALSRILANESDDAVRGE